MTSEVQGNKELEPAQPIPHDDQHSCLCCLHFAVDFDSMPEVLKSKRPSRHPKRQVNG
ncbi:MAG TPA: hypothetical protein VHF22_09315 [Planctomycetota bacterium]|nr:hypothetical protein [Planctomycetota bacterium]